MVLAPTYIYTLKSNPTREEDWIIEHYPNTSQQYMEARIASQDEHRPLTVEKAMLEKIRNRKRKVRSNRTTNRALRKKYSKSKVGILERRKYVKRAMSEIWLAKRVEVKPRIKGKRNSKKVTGEEVQRWLSAKKVGNYNIKTVLLDMQSVRQ